MGDLSSICGLLRSPGEGNGYSLQYSVLENSTDWTVHGVANDWVTFTFLLVSLTLGQAFFRILSFLLFKKGFVCTGLRWVGATFHCGSFSSCRPQTIGTRASVAQYSGSGVVAHRLSCPSACGIFPNQGSQNPIPCTGRWIPIHYAIREIHSFLLLIKILSIQKMSGWIWFPVQLF